MVCEQVGFRDLYHSVGQGFCPLIAIERVRYSRSIGTTSTLWLTLSGPEDRNPWTQRGPIPLLR